MTKPGNIQAKHIIHMVGQTKEEEITSSMLKVLKMCEDNKIQSVSIPALGTGRRNNIVVSLLKNEKWHLLFALHVL
jgi:O-acetyl-ADP-ribose deacetylase (regulator of RNase III)